MNTEHLAILNQGIKVWNKWREDNPSINPELDEAELSKAYLREANLSKTSLRKAELIRVDLFGANLEGAKLSHSFLGGSNLCGANLNNASLFEANLKYSNLKGANINNADLRYACLMDANFSKAELMKTYLYNANLGRADLNEANLSGAFLDKASLNQAVLCGANLSKARLWDACFVGANLSNADLSNALSRGANFTEANLERANLIEASLEQTDFTEANLKGTNLTRANISRARIIGAKLNNATLTDCRVFGTASWGNTGLEEAEQSNLVITDEDESIITVDNLEVAQFIYLLLNSKKLRYMIDAITTKVVLILGRFTDERKAVLDAIREELRKQNYLPMLFDFEKPKNRNLTETIRTLAGLARFIIADITDAKSIPQELQAIVPHNPSVPVQPLILKSAKEYGMFLDFKDYPWVLGAFQYDDVKNLIVALKEKVIDPAENKANEMQERRSGLV